MVPGGRVGSSMVRRMVIGRSAHGSSSASSMTHGLSCGLVPWLNQSWIMNCSQAATRELTPSAAAELVAGQQPPADLARAGVQDVVAR